MNEAFGQQLGDMLSQLILEPGDLGGRVVVTGRDPFEECSVPIAAIGALALVAKCFAVGAIWRDRSGAGQDIEVDLELAARSVSPFVGNYAAILNGYPVLDDDPYSALNLDFYETADDRYVCLLNPSPRLRERALRILDVRNSRSRVSQAVRRWPALELERAIQSAGAACTVVRSRVEWDKHEQHAFVVDRPLIEITKIGDSDPEPVGGERPLSGLRALGLADQIAATQIGSGLAEYGADVLNVWRPGAFETNRAYVYGNIGVRSCLLDLGEPTARSSFDRLFSEADVFYSNRRGAWLSAHELGAQDCHQRRPGIIHATISAFGSRGPWSDLAGFDPHALSVTGVADMEGGTEGPRLPPTLILNDFVAGWLAAAGVAAALRRRAIEGGSWQVEVSLARCSMWFQSLAANDDLRVGDDVGARRGPNWLRASTPLGDLCVLGTQAHLSRTPAAHEQLLFARGASAAKWAR